MTAQHGGGTVWLDVPYAEKNEAKQLGARWDAGARRWYAGPHARPELHARWAAAPELPELLPGEDRCFGAGLHVDLIAETTWFSNVRSSIDGRDWDRLRRMLHRRAGGCCELCGRGEDRAAGRRLEAHERFGYDDTTSVQVLRRLVLVCSDCHEATHYGLAQVRGRDAAAFAHLRAVTGMTEQQTVAHIEEAFALWRARSNRVWVLDLSPLTAAGITVTPPDGAVERAEQAVARLGEHRPDLAAGARTLPGPAPREMPDQHGAGCGCCAEDLGPGVHVREVSAAEAATSNDPIARWMRGDPDAPTPTAIYTSGGGWRSVDPASAATNPESDTSAAPTAAVPQRRHWWRRNR